VAGAASVLLTGGGVGLLALAGTNGPAGADSTLGGFTVTSLAEAMTVQYEQPNFPVPANPSLELDEGYSTSNDNYGPNGSALAATLYPGQVVANAGPQLALLVPGAPLPPAPTWPEQATSSYPQTPNTASTDQPGVNEDATSSSNGNVASTSLGNDAPTAGANGADPGSVAPSSGGNPFAGGASTLFAIGSMSSTSSSTAPSTTATSEGSATVHGVTVLGGFITIGSVTSTASATSDGTTGKVSGSTLLSNLVIAGEPVTLNAQGISAAGQSSPLSIPVSSINQLLSQLGISMALTNPTDTVNGPSASRTLDGVQITINLDTLDKAANEFAALLPEQLTSQLPIAVPDEQQITVDLAHVDVSSTASPPFVANSGNTAAASVPSTNGSTSALGSTPASSTGGFTGNTGTGGSSSFSPGTTGNSGAGTTGTPGGSSGSSPTSTASAPTSAIGPAFKGVGALLLLLGLLAAGSLAYLYKRADDATELATAACADGDPLGERFSAAPAEEELADFGGFNA
jgi:hypothetical protein